MTNHNMEHAGIINRNAGGGKNAMFCPTDGCQTILFRCPKPFWLHILESFVCTKCFIRVAPMGVLISEGDPGILRIQFQCDQCGDIFSQQIEEVRKTCSGCGETTSIFPYHELKIRYRDHYAAAFKWAKECRRKENE